MLVWQEGGCTAATGCGAVVRAACEPCLGEWSRQACTVFALLDYAWLQHYHGLAYGEGHMEGVGQHP